MSETLPKDVQEFVHQSVADGDYASDDDVVIAGVRALRELKQRHAELRQDIQLAVEELDRGEGEPWDAATIKGEFDRQLDADSRTDICTGCTTFAALSVRSKIEGEHVGVTLYLFFGAR